ncbi:hypothetical protein Tco_0001836 [Tanacetum coccineum]
MFGNKFISVIEPDTKLGKGMVLHKDYLLGGSYHRNDSLFLLNCYGVRWQVENLPLQFEPNAYPTPKSDTVALFVNDREYKVYLAKLPSVNAPYCSELIVFGPGLSEWFNLTVFNKFGEALMVYENYATYVLRNASCHIGEEPDYDEERMGWFCNWQWHTTHADEHISFYKKLTPKVLKMSRIRKRAIFEMFSTPTLRCMKDRSGFWAEQWVRFYLSEDTTLKDGVIRFEVC